MARKAILTQPQCKKIRTLRANGVSAVNLAKQFGVSESSLYKVLDGSYKARKFQSLDQLPVVHPERPGGITPSLFEGAAPRLVSTHPALHRMVEKARSIDDVELDEVTIAAAELVLAKARLAKLVGTPH